MGPVDRPRFPESSDWLLLPITFLDECQLWVEMGLIADYSRTWRAQQFQPRLNGITLHNLNWITPR